MIWFSKYFFKIYDFNKSLVNEGIAILEFVNITLYASNNSWSLSAIVSIIKLGFEATTLLWNDEIGDGSNLKKMLYKFINE